MFLSQGHRCSSLLSPASLNKAQEGGGLWIPRAALAASSLSVLTLLHLASQATAVSAVLAAVRLLA